jgi:hypothetical protein
MGGSNMIRSEMTTDTGDEFVRGGAVRMSSTRVRSTVVRLLALSCCIALLTWAGDRLVLARILAPSWHAMIMAVPTMAVSVLPVTVALAQTVLLAADGRQHAAIPIRVGGALFAIAIGFAAAINLTLGVTLAVVRDLLIMILLYRQTRAWRLGPVVAATVILTTLLATISLVLDLS